MSTACAGVAEKLQWTNPESGITSLRPDAMCSESGSPDCEIAKRLPPFFCGWAGWSAAFSGTASRWVVVCRNSASTSARAIGSSLDRWGTGSSSSFAVETRGASMRTSRARNVTGRRGHATPMRTKAHADFLRKHLASDTNAIALLDAAFVSGDEGDIMYALRAVAQARGGMANIAESAGLSRETLYRTLSRGGNPRLSTLLAVMRAVRIGIKAVASA